MYTKDNAIEQFQPYADKYLKVQNIILAYSTKTKKIFNTYKSFKAKIRIFFKVVDKVSVKILDLI